MSLREYNRKACIACNFNCLIGTEELLKATDNQVHSKSGNILETGDAVSAANEQEWLCTRIAAFRTTLSSL